LRITGYATAAGRPFVRGHDTEAIAALASVRGSAARSSARRAGMAAHAARALRAAAHHRHRDHARVVTADELDPEWSAKGMAEDDSRARVIASQASSRSRERPSPMHSPRGAHRIDEGVEPADRLPPPCPNHFVRSIRSVGPSNPRLSIINSVPPPSRRDPPEAIGHIAITQHLHGKNLGRLSVSNAQKHHI